VDKEEFLAQFRALVEEARELSSRCSKGELKDVELCAVAHWLALILTLDQFQNLV